MTSLIDSHAHLAEQAYDDDRTEVLRRASDAGVECVIVVGYDAPSSLRAIEVVREWADASEHLGSAPPVALFATAGIAPHHVNEADAEALTSVRSALEADPVVAVGEVGLDYHYDMPRDAQRQLFSRQLDWARELDLPAVIHSREAEDDVVGLLRQRGASSLSDARRRTAPAGDEGDGSGSERRLRGVIHCFTESTAMAEAVVDLGFYVSFAGIITFKSASDLRETASRVPLDRTLIETDSPYLAPVPHRGRRNEPAYVAEVARCIADVHGTSPEEVATVTSKNVRELFRLPAE